jgi:hypothetical protein
MSRRGEAVIVVHQMAKVGSRSWVEAAKPPAGRMEAMPLHCHFVMPHNRETIAAAYRDPAKQQTIANMLLPRNMLRSGAAAWAEIEGARARGEVIRVITGIRDPIARSISFAVFMADFYGHTTLPLSPRAPMSADFAIDFLQKNWKAVLDGQTPDSTFEWLLWFVTGAYRTWFDDELLAAHGIDLRATPFERGAGVQHVRGGLAEILAYRAEDMLPSSRGHDGLLQQARAFLGTEITANFGGAGASGKNKLRRIRKRPALGRARGVSLHCVRRDDAISVLCRPGSDRLSRGLSRSTIGAGGFNGRVRNGIGWNSPARTTRSAKNGKARHSIV